MKNLCIDCKKEITKGSRRCRSCENHRRAGSNHPGWTGKYSLYNYCIDCGKEIRRTTKGGRCNSCAKIGNKHSLGKHTGLRSEEVKEKIRVAAIEQFKNPKQREEASKRMIGNHYALDSIKSEESKEKNRIAQLKYIQTHLGHYKDTKPELKMKDIFDRLNIRFEHQVRIKGIPHIWDFRKKGANVLIEVDGKYWHTLSGARERDYKFNRLAKKEGYTVLRFWDDDIMKHEEKVIKILKEKFICQ